MTWAYLETSALLEWALDQPRADEVAACVGGDTRLCTSHLLLLEASRVLTRLPPGLAQLAAERIATLRPRLDVVPMEPWLEAELRRPLPIEPVRTLDAIHLVTALAVRRGHEAVDFLALDVRVRENARALGFRVVP